MNGKTIEYVFRIGPLDRYRHLHIQLDSEIVLIPEFDAELREFNLSLGNKIESEGGKVAYIVIKDIYPKSHSRLTHVELMKVA